MMRLAVAVLALFCGLLSSQTTAASPFRLHIRGKAVASSGNLIPGSNAGGAGWALTSAPAAIGNPADDGYADVAVARLDQEQHKVIRTGESFHLGVLARHIPTLTEYNAGQISNICEVDFAVDGGSWTPVTTETLNPDTGITDHNINIRESDFATTGPHEVRWQAIPCTGYPLLGQGDYPIASIGTIFGTGGGAISGTTLTATNWSGVHQIKVGDSVIGVGVSPNTYITADTGGGGGDGTYTVNISQTVSQEYMELNDAPSFIFYTSHSNAIPQRLIYISTTGNDTTGNGSSSNPFATLIKAVNPGFGDQLNEEWYLCLMAGTHQITSAVSGGSGMSNLKYWAHIQPSSQAPCDGTGSGAVTLDASIGQANNNNLGMAQAMYDGVSIIKSRGINGSNNFGSGATRMGSMLAFKNLSYKGLGFNDVDAGVGAVTGGLWCIGIQVSLIGNGCNSNVSTMVANSTFDYISVDVLSNSWFTYGNTITNHGVFPALGTTASGSNLVTGLTIDTSKFGVGFQFGTLSNTSFPQPGACSLPYAFTVASIVSPNSLTVSGNSAVSESNVPAGAFCGHPDVLQLEFSRFNVLAANNDASATTNNYGRGLSNNNSQLRWAITDNKFHEGGGAAVWSWGAPYMESILYANNQNTGGASFVPASGSTFVRAYHLNNTCTSVVNHPTGTIFRGGTC